MSFVPPPNIILLICVAVVGSIIGFIIHGIRVGFENTLTENDEKPKES